MRSRFPSPSRRRVRLAAHIQITPLIDVLLVLLVLGYLMWTRVNPGQTGAVAAPVATPMLEAMTLRLPSQSIQPAISDAPGEQDMLIGLRRQGQLSWQGRPVTLEQLARQLQEQLARDPGAPVWLAIDATTPYADVIHWFDWLQAKQVSRLNLLTTGSAPGRSEPEASRKP